MNELFRPSVKRFNLKDENFKFMDIKDFKLLDLIYPPQEGIERNRFDYKNLFKGCLKDLHSFYLKETSSNISNKIL